MIGAGLHADASAISGREPILKVKGAPTARALYECTPSTLNAKPKRKQKRPPVVPSPQQQWLQVFGQACVSFLCRVLRFRVEDLGKFGV